MSTLPYDSTRRFQQLPSQRVGQIRKGNQNARRHGLYSQLDPTPPEHLATIAREAAAVHDLTTIKAVARSFDAWARRAAADGAADAAKNYRHAAGRLRQTIRTIERAAVFAGADALLVAHTTKRD